MTTQLVVSDTIIAQCTPKGSGALAVIRLSGPQAVEIATSISKLGSNQRLIDLSTHTIHYGWVLDQSGAIIDQVLFLLMHGPRTFTGEDVVEITCHNNPFLIERIIERALACGARLAGPGEFTQRAYLNGKIDLVQAEAINELIHASTQTALKQALSQLEGSFSHWITTLEQDLIKCLALCEASFEFLDEEMEFGPQIKERIEHIKERIAKLKKTFNQQQHIRQGVRIALIGSVNAGKSSLFNALIGQNRAIVTPIAGTTRDSIEAGLYRNSAYWTLIDTAGLRQTQDIVEKEGIARSFEQAHKADIILLIYDGSREMTDQERAIYQELIQAYSSKIIVICNKADLQQYSQELLSLSHTPLLLSSQQGTYLDQLERVIEERIEHLFKTIESPFLLNERHYNLLLALEHKLDRIHLLLEGPIAYELLSCHLREALEHLTELTGKTISEQGMDAVFREFCVGK